MTDIIDTMVKEFSLSEYKKQKLFEQFKKENVCTKYLMGSIVDSCESSVKNFFDLPNYEELLYKYNYTDETQPHPEWLICNKYQTTFSLADYIYELMSSSYSINKKLYIKKLLNIYLIKTVIF